MPTQKTFKRRVRARMTKTGESYTSARHQLLRKSGEGTEPGDEALPTGPAAVPAGVPADRVPADEAAASPDLPGSPTDAVRHATSDAAIRRATGRGHDEWFALLDGWGAAGRRHPEIARWLEESHGVGAWWAQSITVDYERARGLRARHQNSDGFSLSVSRTIAGDADRLLVAFTDPAIRGRWLPDVDMRPRPTRAAMTARFDWPEPASRVVVTVVPKGEARATVVVTHEGLAGPEAVETLKAAWRSRLADLKAMLEGAAGERLPAPTERS